MIFTSVYEVFCYETIDTPLRESTCVFRHLCHRAYSLYSLFKKSIAYGKKDTNKTMSILE